MKQKHGHQNSRYTVMKFLKKWNKRKQWRKTEHNWRENRGYVIKDMVYGLDFEEGKEKALRGRVVTAWKKATNKFFNEKQKCCIYGAQTLAVNGKIKII